MSLPWTEVNESDPNEVAFVLELEYSPRGGRKRSCPFCGGRNFSPLNRAWYCHSGCGGRAYSNIDTAAAHWECTAAQACARLATLLGIATVDPDPPWAQIAASHTQEVATALSLQRGEGAWQWNCPTCGGAGTLRSYQKKWRCGSPMCSGDEKQGWRGHVDLAMAVWQSSPIDACRRLAAALGCIAPAQIPPAPRPQRRHLQEDVRATALAAIQSRPGAHHPTEFYRLLIDHLRLGTAGQRELTRRQIDPGVAEAYGFRSVEAGEWTRRILPFMTAFSNDELIAAGFPPKYPGAARARRRPWWPGYGRAPLLVIPFWDGNRLASIRFRNLADPEETGCPRYISPVRVPPQLPFNLAGLASGARTVLLTEGELNAFVPLCEPYRMASSGLPGAGVWQDSWSALIRDSTRLIITAFDSDKAGRMGAIRVRDSLARVRGFEWAYERWRASYLKQDICDLHALGQLATFLHHQARDLRDVQRHWADPIRGNPSPRPRRDP